MTTIVGKLIKWNVIFQEFTLSAPQGNIKINIEECDGSLLDEFIKAMKDRKDIEIKVSE